MFQFKIALHLETYWKTKHDTFGFRYLEQVLYLDSLLEKNGSFMQKHLFLFYWIQLPQWHTIQKHCFYFTQSKLPQWHHTKAVFLFYPIKATTMTPYKSIVFILHNQTTIWKSQENDWVNTGIVYFTVCLITEIYQDMSFSFHDADSSKYRNKTNLILKK